jgi:hypothetical protein
MEPLAVAVHPLRQPAVRAPPSMKDPVAGGAIGIDEDATTVAPTRRPEWRGT